MDQNYYCVDAAEPTVWLQTFISLACFEGWVKQTQGSGTYDLIRGFDGSTALQVIIA